MDFLNNAFTNFIMNNKTGLPNKIIIQGASAIIEQIQVFNHLHDFDNFTMCKDDINKDTQRYVYDSDWYATYMYTSSGVKKLVAMACVNNTHPEFEEDNIKSIHLSAIEVDPKYRDSELDIPLHAFSKTIRALITSAKKAGYNRMTLQAKDLDKVPKYEHLGFKILDLSLYDGYNENLDFYNKHPVMYIDF